jgi:16S rRNA (uracil1498-N3)-methyltransferase
LHQLYVDSVPEPGQTLWLGGEERHYLGRALRARPGERFRLAAADGRAARAELKGFRGEEAELLVEAWDPDPAEAFELHLALCPPRGDALDEALEMAVQLGVRSVRLCRSERTLAEPGQGPLKPERLEKRLREAARQCLRAQLPVLLPALSLPQALAEPSDLRRLLLSERGGQALAQAIQGQRRFLLLVGPEGGFSAAEHGAAAEAGWLAVSLGPHPLRSPTAVAAACAGLRALQPQP